MNCFCVLYFPERNKVVFREANRMKFRREYHPTAESLERLEKTIAFLYVQRGGSFLAEPDGEWMYSSAD